VASMQSRPQAPGTGAASADQFRLLVDAVKDYAIFLLDPEGHVVSWNTGAERIKGYTAEEILGQHFSRFYEPDDVAAGVPAEMLARAAAEGRHQARGWRVRKDGGRFYAQVTLTALVDSQGRLTGYAKITQDVTAELEAERVRREREDQLAEAQAVAQLGSFEWDLAGDQVTWSPELYRILGRDPASYRGTLDGLLGLFHAEDRAEVEATLRRAAVDGASFRIQARVLRPSGEERVLSSWGTVIRDDQGRPSRMLGVCQDVTDWHQREEALVEAQAQAELSRRLQSGLLPSLSLPDPALALRTRYRPGHERALLGADFFDALPLADGTVALLIGDVAGHGPAEAAVGVALRSAWRALVLTGHRPDELLDGLDKVLVCNRQSEELFATGPRRPRRRLAVAGRSAGARGGLDPAVLHRRAGRGPPGARVGGPVRGRGAGRGGGRAAGRRGRARRGAGPPPRPGPGGQRRRPVGRRGHPLPVPGPATGPAGPRGGRPWLTGGRCRPGSPCPAARPAWARPAASSRPGPPPGRSPSRPAPSWG
jgi:PAS domain S-box-containing protein